MLKLHLKTPTIPPGPIEREHNFACPHWPRSDWPWRSSTSRNKKDQHPRHVLVWPGSIPGDSSYSGMYVGHNRAAASHTSLHTSELRWARLIGRPLSTSSLARLRWSAGQAEAGTGLTGASERQSLAS
jgi:hypothetical protein